MKKDTEQKKMKRIGRADIPTIFADQINVSARLDKLFILTFDQQVDQETLIEQSRVMINESHLKSLIDLLCKHGNYYPKSP